MDIERQLSTSCCGQSNSKPTRRTRPYYQSLANTLHIQEPFEWYCERQRSKGPGAVPVSRALSYFRSLSSPHSPVFSGLTFSKLPEIFTKLGVEVKFAEEYDQEHVDKFLPKPIVQTHIQFLDLLNANANEEGERLDDKERQKRENFLQIPSSLGKRSQTRDNKRRATLRLQPFEDWKQGRMREVEIWGTSEELLNFQLPKSVMEIQFTTSVETGYSEKLGGTWIHPKAAHLRRKRTPTTIYRTEFWFGRLELYGDQCRMTRLTIDQENLTGAKNSTGERVRTTTLVRIAYYRLPFAVGQEDLPDFNCELDQSHSSWTAEFKPPLNTVRACDQCIENERLEIIENTIQKQSLKKRLQMERKKVAKRREKSRKADRQEIRQY